MPQTTIAALEEVLGGRLTGEQQSRLWDYLGIVLKPHIVTAFNYKQVRGDKNETRLGELVFCNLCLS